MKKSTLLLLCLSVFGLMTSAYAGPTLKQLRSHARLHALQVPVSPNQPSVNLNTVDAKTLSKSVKGISIARAKAIVAYRDAHGRLNSLEELAKVKGISSRTLKKYRELWRQALLIEKSPSR